MATVMTTSALSKALVESTLMAAFPVNPPVSPVPLRKAVVLSRTMGTAAFGPASPACPVKTTWTNCTFWLCDR